MLRRSRSHSLVCCLLLFACGGATTKTDQGSMPSDAGVDTPDAGIDPTALRWSKIAAGLDRYCGLTAEDSRLVCVQEGRVTLDREGPFLDMSFHEDLPIYSDLCTIDAAGKLACENFQDAVPRGEFVKVATGFFNSCALDREGRVACWVPPELGGTPAPELTGGLELSVDMNHGCVVFDALGHTECFGDTSVDGLFQEHLLEIAVAPTRVCGVALGSPAGPGITCIESDGEGSQVLSGSFVELDVDVDGHGCALDGAGSIRCWGGLQAPDAPAGFTRLSVSSSQVCVLDATDHAHCFEL